MENFGAQDCILILSKDKRIFSGFPEILRARQYVFFNFRDTKLPVFVTSF